MTVFHEYLGGFGGRILDGGRVTVGSPAAVQALTVMRDEIYRTGIVPQSALTWHEEESRFAFQNGETVFMRNWPYAYALMQDSSASRVAGRYAVAVMPAAPGGQGTASLGGAQLAINVNSEHPEAAWRVIEFLTQPQQMLERARGVGQFPTRVALFDDPALAQALGPSRRHRRGRSSSTRYRGPSHPSTNATVRHPAGVPSTARLPGNWSRRPPSGRQRARCRALLDRAGLGRPGSVAGR